MNFFKELTFGIFSTSIQQLIPALQIAKYDKTYAQIKLENRG